MKNVVYRAIQNIGLIIVSLGLLFGGIAILNTKIPFWSLVYGISAIGLGIPLTIISFNEISKSRSVQSDVYHLVSCKICKKQTLAPALITDIVCVNCQLQMARRLQIGIVTMFLIAIIPVTFHLLQQKQNITQQATIKKNISCEQGIWNPSSCSCGSWVSEKSCPGTARARFCSDVLFCCTSQSTDWNCSIVNESMSK